LIIIGLAYLLCDCHSEGDSPKNLGLKSVFFMRDSSPAGSE